MTTSADTHSRRDPNYALLRIYSYYRTLLSSLLLLMYSAGFAYKILGTHNPQLFLYTAISYTALNILTLLFLWREHFSPRQEQLILLLFIDIVAITLLMHSSGGPESGLGYLLLVCIASGSIFLKRQSALLVAALASILVIGDSIYNAYHNISSSKDVFSAGTLGVLLFITALLFRYLTNRLQDSQIETALQTEHAAHLERLAQQIVERMNTGIIVVNRHHKVLLLNRAAQKLLDLPYSEQAFTLIPEIEDQLQIWMAYPHSRSPFIKLSDDSAEVRINFARLDQHKDSDILIFIEDNRQISQQAQHLKLASLGRLTASIAHEVRNPLGAISHASQLLAESPTLDKADHRLTEIISSHSTRVNQIIENVLQLSRRKGTEAESLELGAWLDDFTQEYQQCSDISPTITVEKLQPDIMAKADPGQLHQILTNLTDNGLRFSKEQTGTASLVIRTGIDPVSDLAFIEVIDEGPGLMDEQIDQVFEPFFTSAPTGSGLGLYICKELCEANEATLAFKRTENSKSCFRINLAHHQRVFR